VNSYKYFNDLLGKELLKESRNLYFSCIGKPHNQIVGVSDTQKYYRDGRIHHITEETPFSWSLIEEQT
jgi:hypothetical protein